MIDYLLELLEADLNEKPKELQAPNNKDMLSSVSFKCLDNNWLEGDKKDS